MKKPIRSYIAYHLIALFLCGTILSSCEKIPGHEVVPKSGSSTTSGGGSSGSGSSGGTGSGSGSGSGSSGGTGSGSGSGSGVTVNPSAGQPNSNGVGPIAVGASNTIIFQINGGSITTASKGNGYVLSLTCLDYGLGTAQTAIVAANSSGSSIITISYLGNGVGTYSGISSSITTGSFSLSDVTGTETINVSTSNVTPSSLTTFSPTTGTVKGTFDGTMIDSTSGLTLRVTGSFNITQ